MNSQNSNAPSKVLHVRTESNLEKEVDLKYILPYLSDFGKIVYVVTMPKIRQALVEMETLESAVKVVEETKGYSVDISGKRFYFQFSKSQSINREPSYRRSIVEHKGERILLVTVHNPLYPITIDVVTSIMSPYKVVRIVIFHTNGIQFLAEFETAENAEAAKDGCIYFFFVSEF
jgi:heterogeneous nuclear ribonucleoprotein L